MAFLLAYGFQRFPLLSYRLQPKKTKLADMDNTHTWAAAAVAALIRRCTVNAARELERMAAELRRAAR